MDHRKLLIIILSVAVFVALIIGLALLAYYPGDEPARRAEVDRDDFDPIEFVRRGEDPEGELADDDEDDDFVIVYGTREEERRDEDVDEHDPPEDVQPEDVDDEVAVEPLADPEEREPRVHGRDRDAEPDTAPEERAEPEPQPEPEPTAQPEAPEPAEETGKAPEPAPEETGPRQEYWIQVISSSSRDTAEAARERLEARNVGSVIFPVTVSGQEFYRVRVGPYENPESAHQFLGWIQDLDGFEESYVSLVTRS